MAPTNLEVEITRSAKLLIYLWKKIGHPVEEWAEKIAHSSYPVDERPVVELCAALKDLDPQTRDAIVYNARDRNARDLADWWEEHQAADIEREKRETEALAREKIREGALAKLSKEERKILGL